MSNIQFEPGTELHAEGIAILEARNAQFTSTSKMEDTPFFETLSYPLDNWVEEIDQKNSGNLGNIVDINDFNGNWPQLLRARDFLLRAGPEARDFIDPQVWDLPGNFLNGENPDDDIVAARIEAQTASDAALETLLASIPLSGSVEYVFGKKNDLATPKKLSLIQFIGKPVISGRSATLVVKLSDGSYRNVVIADGAIESPATGAPASGDDMESKIERFYKIAAKVATPSSEEDLRTLYDSAQDRIAEYRSQKRFFSVYSIFAGLLVWHGMPALVRSQALHYSKSLLATINKQKAMYGLAPNQVARSFSTMKEPAVYIKATSGGFLGLGAKPSGDPILISNRKDLVWDALKFESSEFRRIQNSVGYRYVPKILTGGFLGLGALTLYHSIFGPAKLNDDYFKKYKTYDEFRSALRDDPEMAEAIHFALWREKHT